MSRNLLAGPRIEIESTSSWQIWGLIKQELLFLCWALMDVAIITPIALIIMRWSRYWSEGLIFFWFLLLILLPFNLVRLLSALDLSRNRQWRLILVVLVITLLVSWRGILYAPRSLLEMGWLGEFFGRAGDLGNPLWARDFTVFLFVLVAWWRGLRLAQMTPDIYRIGFRLRAGGLLLAPIAFFMHANGRLWGVTPYILLYFLAGLTAVALIRAEQIERDRSGFAASLTPSWVLIVFITSLMVVATAGTMGAIIGGEGMTVFSSQLAPLWTALTFMAAISLSTVIYLLTPAINLLASFISWLTAFISGILSRLGLGLGPEGLMSIDALQPFGEIVREDGPVTLDLPADISRSLIVVIMLIAAAIITFTLTRFFRQPSTATRSSSAQTQLNRVDEPEKGFGRRLFRRLGLMNRWRTAASIRRIYSEMCAKAGAAGYPRGLAETPYEYLDTLYSAWPNNRSDTALITEAYIRVRYGEIPETENELEAIKTAWEKLADLQSPAEAASVTLN